MIIYTLKAFGFDIRDTSDGFDILYNSADEMKLAIDIMHLFNREYRIAHWTETQGIIFF